MCCRSSLLTELFRWSSLHSCGEDLETSVRCVCLCWVWVCVCTEGVCVYWGGVCVCVSVPRFPVHVLSILISCTERLQLQSGVGIMETLVGLPFAVLECPNIKLKKPSWLHMPSAMTVYAVVIVSYFLITGGGSEPANRLTSLLRAENSLI